MGPLPFTERLISTTGAIISRTAFERMIIEANAIAETSISPPATRHVRVGVVLDAARILLVIEHRLSPTPLITSIVRGRHSTRLLTYWVRVHHRSWYMTSQVPYKF